MGSHYTVLNSEFVPLATVKKVLKKKKDNVTYEQKMALEHAEEFMKIDEKEALKLIADMKALNIAKLKEDMIVKIADLVPQNIEELKLILSASRISFKDEEISSILNLVKSVKA